MNPKLRQICGCEICVIPKDMQIELNGFRKIPVKYLPQKSVGRNTCKSLFSTTSAASYKDIVFPYGECLHATIKDADHRINCIPNKPNNMIHINYY